MMVFNQALAQSGMQAAVMGQQFNDVTANRADPRHALPANIMNNFEVKEGILMPKAPNAMATNAGARPADLYREWDTQTVAQFRLDEGDNILNRLMPLARSLPIGRTVLANTRASDAGTFQQSMSGEIKSIFDNVDYDTDGTIVPVNQNGFKRNWREGEQLSLEAFDDASNQQREATRTHRQGVIGSLMDGHRNTGGQLIVEDGLSWAGVRADARVDQVDLGAGGLNFDFTSTTTTGEDFRNAWIQLVERRYITNKVTASATWFVSNEIYFNMIRKYSEQYSSGSILENIMTIPGVGEVVQSSVLTGNQILSIPMSTTYIQPLVGMGVSTIACPRVAWNDPFAFEVVSAIGWQVKTDFEDQGKALQYASS